MIRKLLSLFAIFLAVALSGCSMSDIFPKWNDPAYFGDEDDLLLISMEFSGGKYAFMEYGSGTGNETWKADW